MYDLCACCMYNATWSMRGSFKSNTNFHLLKPKNCLQALSKKCPKSRYDQTSHKRPPVVWLLEATTSLKRPPTLRILGGHLQDVQLQFTYNIYIFFTSSSGTGSGAEERGATGGPPQSTSVDVVATPKFSAGGVKLGNSQSLRVRMDSYPAGKLHCSFFVVVDKVYSSCC